MTKNKKYFAANINKNGVRKTIYLHRLILNVEETNIQVDHVNCDTTDNRKCNLRIATTQQNKYNTNKYNGYYSSIYKGVSKHRNKWISYISFEKRRYFLGCFDSEIEAAKAYNEAAIKFFGEFARLNEIVQ